MSIQVRFGTYSGTGVDGLSINTGISLGIGSLVLIISATAAAVIRTSEMGGAQSYSFETGVGWVTDMITSFSGNSFVLGTSTRVNNNGTTYYYLALNCSGEHGRIFNYSGDSIDNRDVVIPSGSFQPDIVIIVPHAGSASASSDCPFIKIDTMPATESRHMINSTTSALTTAIKAINSNGFRVGTLAAVNQTGRTYSAICLKLSALVGISPQWTGDGSASRNITGFGINPGWALVISEDANVSQSTSPTIRHPNFGTNNGKSMNSTGGFDTNAIRSFITDGINIGNNENTNIGFGFNFVHNSFGLLSGDIGGGGGGGGQGGGQGRGGGRGGGSGGGKGGGKPDKLLVGNRKRNRLGVI